MMAGSPGFSSQYAVHKLRGVAPSSSMLFRALHEATLEGALILPAVFSAAGKMQDCPSRALIYGQSLLFAAHI